MIHVSVPVHFQVDQPPTEMELVSHQVNAQIKEDLQRATAHLVLESAASSYMIVRQIPKSATMILTSRTQGSPVHMEKPIHSRIQSTNAQMIFVG